jgi:hypothetical protein
MTVDFFSSVILARHRWLMGTEIGRIKVQGQPRQNLEALSPKLPE